LKLDIVKVVSKQKSLSVVKQRIVLKSKSKQTDQRISMSRRAGQVAWLEANLEQFDKQIQGSITSTLELGDAIPDLVINSLYDQQFKAHANILAEAERQEKIKAEAIRLEGVVMKLPITIGIAEDSEQLTKKYFTKIKVGKQQRWVLKDDANLTICANSISAVKSRAIWMAEKPKSTKTTRKRRSASDKVDEWVINTEGEAKAQYKSGLYASKIDLEKKSVYKEQMKVYRAGESDPRKPGDTLENDLVKYQFKAVVRSEPIFDGEDKKRCVGAVAWKGGRYGSEWASYKGFKGSVMSQCSKFRQAGDYCDGCSKKQINFFDTKNRYKKANISYWEAFKGDGVCVKIEK
jgi:hypothetical protein